MHGGENMKYIPIQCKSVIRNVKDKMTPYNYDANIYRGCAHGCIYCYALYSHDYGIQVWTDWRYLVMRWKWALRIVLP